MAIDFDKAQALREALSIIDNGVEKAALTVYNGNPNGNVTGTVGALCIDYSGSGKLWKNTTGSTVWTELGTGGSVSIEEVTFDQSDVVENIVTITHTTGKKYNHVFVFDDLDEEVSLSKKMLSTTQFELDVATLTPISGTWRCEILGAN